MSFLKRCVDGPLLIQSAVQCARHSNHPVSQAIVRSFSTEGLPDLDDGAVMEFQDLVFNWSPRMIKVITQERSGWGVCRGSKSVVSWFPTCKSGTWVAENERCLRSFGFADGIERVLLICSIQSERLVYQRRLSLTGDASTEAERVSTELEIQHVVAGALPEEKWQLVQSLKHAGHTVCVVGDGINDALALQEADVGIAIGASINQAAMGGSDVALVSEDLMAIPELIRLSDAVHRKILQNVWIGFGMAAVLKLLYHKDKSQPYRRHLCITWVRYW